MARFLCSIPILLCLAFPGPAAADFIVADVTGAEQLSDAEGNPLRLDGLVYQPDNDAGRDRLRALAQGKRLRLEAVRQNRYGDPMAQAYLPDGRWLNGLLIAEGWMLAAPLHPDDALRRRLFALETQARDARRGHWKTGRFRIHDATHYRGPRDAYAIVTGRPLAIARRRNFLFLNFGEDWTEDFTAAIARRDLKAFRGFDLDALEGRRLRLRGHIRWWNGPFMELSDPGQIEILQDGQE